MATPPHHEPVRDRFDDAAREVRRVGAHRRTLRATGSWKVAVGALLAIVVLTVSGLWGLSKVDTNFTPPWVSLFGGTNAKPVIPGDSALPPADIHINPELPITIINGTPTAGLANQVGDLLVGKGWDGASVEVGARVNAEERTVTKTVVYYDAPENEAAAHGLIASLGVGVAHFSSDYPASPLALVLGADYVPTEPPAESDPDVAGE